MKRVIIILSFAAIGVMVFLMVQKPTSQITVVGAKAFSKQGSDMFMVTLTIENAGAPDVLLGAVSPDAQMVSLMNPDHPSDALVVPGAGAGILAMDGAHLMMRLDGHAFEQGAFVPITLEFAQAGVISTRVEHAGAAQMTHDMGFGVEVRPAPQLTLESVGEPAAEGFDVTLSVENFELVRVAGDAEHVAPQGHAHVYLNGLKLARLYEPKFHVGALLAGDYVLRVALNSNDHRPYLDSGAPVSKILEFSIP